MEIIKLKSFSENSCHLIQIGSSSQKTTSRPMTSRLNGATLKADFMKKHKYCGQINNENIIADF